MAQQKEIARLRELSEQELLTEVKEAKAELFNLKFQWKATGQLANSARLGALRNKVARIQTVLREQSEKGE